MNKHSIFFTIHLSFGIAMILICASFFTLYQYNNQVLENFVLKRHIDIGKIIMKTRLKTRLKTTNTHKITMSKSFQNSLKDIGFEIILAKKKQDILQNIKIDTIYIQHTKYGVIKYLKLNNNHLMYIKMLHNDILLLDKSEHIHINKQQHILTIIFILTLIISIFLLTTIKNKLKPLQELKKDMENLSNGIFIIPPINNGKDEISQVANEFYNMIKKIDKFRQSRNIFIRNIMHELKTPITKGKILLDLENTKNNKEKMKKVFYRLEALINEFASIEELIATKDNIIKKDYLLADIIDNSIDILMCDSQNTIIDIDNRVLNVNFNIFSIAIKNIIDNGIKYSPENQTTISTKNNKIIFKNMGEKLKYPLDEYFEAFFKGQNNKNDSFGLGLYITKHILDFHNYKLEYEYKDKFNIFYLSEIS
jgi:two-component system OmpR family sensor kinase